MDMKRILQALDSAATKNVEGASDMSKFLKIVKENAQVPAMPNVAGLQPGQSKDLGDGAKVTVNKDGSVSYSGAWGTYVYNAQGQHIKTLSPSFAGVQNTSNADGSSSTSYQQGPLSVKQDKDASGNTTSTDAEYQLGAEKIRQQKVGNKTTNSVAEMSFKDYVQLAEEKVLKESLADEFMKMAREKGMNPRLRGTPDEERARTDAMLKQRAADRANAPQPEGPSAEERANLEDKLKSLEAQFDPDFEYSDDYSFWSKQNEIRKRIAFIKRILSQGMSEGLKDPKDNPCWKGYKPVGTKKKNGKTVPNCVPKE